MKNYTKRKKPVLTQAINLSEKIKVRLDHRTLIVINNIASLEAWKKKFPDARVI